MFSHSSYLFPSKTSHCRRKVLPEISNLLLSKGGHRVSLCPKRWCWKGQDSWCEGIGAPVSPAIPQGPGPRYCQLGILVWLDFRVPLPITGYFWAAQDRADLPWEVSGRECSVWAPLSKLLCHPSAGTQDLELPGVSRGVIPTCSGTPLHVFLCSLPLYPTGLGRLGWDGKHLPAKHFSCIILLAAKCKPLAALLCWVKAVIDDAVIQMSPELWPYIRWLGSRVSWLLSYFWSCA